MQALSYEVRIAAARTRRVVLENDRARAAYEANGDPEDPAVRAAENALATCDREIETLCLAQDEQTRRERKALDKAEDERIQRVKDDLVRHKEIVIAGAADVVAKLAALETAMGVLLRGGDDLGRSAMLLRGDVPLPYMGQEQENRAGFLVGDTLERLSGRPKFFGMNELRKAAVPVPDFAAEEERIAERVAAWALGIEEPEPTPVPGLPAVVAPSEPSPSAPTLAEIAARKELAQYNLIPQNEEDR